METNFETIKLEYSKNISTLQILTSSNIDTTGKGGIKRLLSVSGKARVMSCEALQDEAKISGRITYKIVFLNQDDLIKNYDYVSDFTENVKDEQIKAGAMLSAMLNIVDIDTASSGDEIKLQTVVDIFLSVVEGQEIEYLESIENALTKTADFDIQKFIGSISDSFELQEEFETGTDVGSILLFDSEVAVSSIKSADNHFMISGEVNGQVTYEAANQLICTKNFTLPYCERIEAIGAIEGMEINANAFVKDSRIILAGVEGNNIIRFEVDIAVKGQMFLLGTQNFITDICLPEYEADAVLSEYSFNRFAFQRFYQEKVSGTAALDADMDGIGRILFSSASRNNVANIIAKQNCFVVEGLLIASVVYEDENAEICSVQVELPYSLQFDSESIKPEDDLFAQVTTGCVHAKVRRDREMEVQAELMIELKVNKPVKGQYVSDVAIGAEKSCNMKAITIYICKKGETLWDIAKAMNTPMEMILKQNPAIGDTIEGGEKIMIYRELSVV